MRILVIALALIAVTFAGTTVYFARELALEREQARAIPVPAPSAQPASLFAARAPGQPPATPVTIAGQRNVTQQPVISESDEARMQRLQLEQSRRTLKMLADPAQRESMLLETRMAMRNSYPRLATTLGMSSEEIDRLFTLLAQQQMNAQEQYARCAVDPACNLRDGGYFETDPSAKQIADLLGPQRQQQFENYKNSLMERESVVQLRSRLSDATRLPDETSETLIATLADERQKIHQEAAARGIGMNGYGTGVGMVFSASDAATPEAQYESAQANSRRMRDRAAQVLTPEQLRVFDEMQDELLISLKHQLRQKEELAAGTSFATATIVN